MPDRVLLIRHGQTAWNLARRWQGHADVDLDDEGRAQATAIASRLRTEGIEAIVASDLRRASDTATTIATAVGLRVETDPRWREMDVGDWSGRSRASILERDGALWDRIAAGEDLPRGGRGETWAAFHARTQAALHELVDRPERTIAVVTHGGVIRALVLALLHLPYERLRDVPVLPNTGVLELVPGAPWHLPDASRDVLGISGA